MRIFHDRDSSYTPADVNTFVGRAVTKRLATAVEPDTGSAFERNSRHKPPGGPVAVNVYRVAFEPGARTNWHTHSGSQWLFVVDGRIRVQTWRERPVDVHAGDAVLIAPGEKHWHGAPPDGRGVHLAVNIDAQTEWLEPVSDAEYGKGDSE